MKKFFVILSLFVATTVLAGPVSKEQAWQLAADFVKTRPAAAASKAAGGIAQQADALSLVTLSQNKQEAMAAPFYIFNIGERQGFVIISGDDRTTSVLGYSDEGCIDPERMPENLRYWLDDYAQQLKTLAQMDDTQASKALRAPSRAAVQTRNSIAPLITTKWDQATPYWNKCPQFMNSDDEADGYELAYTGCVATAMSQIMYFHKQPQQTLAEIPAYSFTYSDGNYNYSTVTMDALPVTTLDWAHMRETYTGAENEVYTDAVATLMLYAGCAVKMQYGRNSSGAYTDDIPKGFRYFGYGSKIAFRIDYTQQAWDDLVYSELDAGRPMIYNGTAGSGGGHSFICDGFEYGDYFHINWGWGGMGNGFFQLSILNPSASGIGGSSSSEGYNMKQNIIYNIIPGTATPEGGSEMEEAEPMLTITACSGSSSFNERDDINKPFKIEDSHRVKFSFSDHSGTGNKYQVALALYNPEDKTFEVMGNSSYNAGTVTTSALGDTKDFGLGLKAPRYGQDQRITFGVGKTGTFHIVPIFKVIDSDKDWQLMEKADRYYVEVTLNETSTSTPIYHPVIDLQATNFEFTGNKKVGAKMQVNVTIKNNGDERYFGNIYLDFGGQHLDEYSQYTTVVQAEVPAKESKIVTFNVTPSKSGSNKVYAMIDDGMGDYDVLPGTYGSVYIDEEEAVYTSNLSVKIEALDASAAVKDKTDGTIYDSSVRFKATIKNDNTAEYNKYILAPLFICTWDAEKGKFAGSMVTYKQVTISVPAGESRDYYFDFDNLAYGNIYSMNIYARNNVPMDEDASHVDNIVTPGTSKYYAIEPGIITWKGDGTRQGYQPVEGFAIPEDVAAVSLEGLHLTSISASANPNTLYFLGNGETAPAGLEDKNVVTGAQAAKVVLKDGYDFYTPQTFTAAEISYERTFTQGHNNSVRTGWSTIVLPFAPTKVMNQTDQKQIDWFRSSTDSGKQFWLCDFAEEDGQTVFFRNAPEMLANVPYLVAVPDNAWGSKWDLRGKEIVWSATDATVKPDAIAYTSGQQMVFAGSVYRQELTGILGITADGSQFSTSGEQAVDAFHAYFKTIDGESAGAKALSIAILSDDVNGIEPTPIATQNESEAAAIYDLSGRRIQGNDGSSLPKGIYIINGKKVVK